MQILVHPDSTVHGGPELTAEIEAVVDDALRRFRDQITRVEIHLSDENRRKGGANDKRCALEVRPKGLQPIAVTHQAATLVLAAAGASEKVKKALESTIGRLRGR